MEPTILWSYGAQKTLATCFNRSNSNSKEAKNKVATRTTFAIMSLHFQIVRGVSCNYLEFASQQENNASLIESNDHTLHPSKGRQVS